MIVPGWTYTRNRDKLFFFVGLEVQRQQIDMGARRSVVPTLLQRQGLFTESLVADGQNLGQPVGPVLIPTGFPGAGTPAPEADLGPYTHPLGRLLANLYPLPTGRYNDNSFNYATAALKPLNRLDFKTRVDWNPSANTRTYLRLAREDEHVTGVFGQLGTDLGCGPPEPRARDQPRPVVRRECRHCAEPVDDQRDARLVEPPAA